MKRYTVVPSLYALAFDSQQLSGCLWMAPGKYIHYIDEKKSAPEHDFTQSFELISHIGLLTFSEIRSVLCLHVFSMGL